MTVEDAYQVNESFEPNRERVDIVVGAFVLHQSTVYRIDQVLDFESIVATAVESGRPAQLRIGELRSLVNESMTAIPEDLDAISDEDWQIAQRRYSIIEPFTGGAVNSRKDISAHAKKHDINSATIYRWLKKYQVRGVVTDLIPKKRGWKTGQTRLTTPVNHIIDEVIETVYLTPQRPTAQKAVLEVKRRCHEEGIEPPSAVTIRQRLSDIPEKLRLRRRGFKDLATNRFKPVPGKFPNAEYPLAVVQIDHTPADIILVDEVHRKPIGRPWITLAMDIYTRMVTGYYLSFDAPSETSVGVCVAQSALPKESWLALHGVDATWPVWGFPQTIHVDNGADFRSNNFERSCMQYGINLEFRPVKAPRYGGHIERILGTFLKEMHNLPGTTFSSVKEKASYDAEKHASLTLAEFEVWFVSQITKVYNQQLHTSIGITPAKLWDISIFGNAETTGVGLPPRPENPMSITLDFLPSFERTIQPIGVTIDGRHYYADALRPWVGATEKRTGTKRKFIFRRDPRDISCIWFFDPDLKEYFKVPFADQSLPAISLWEYRQIREKLKREGKASVNEAQLMRAITEQRSHIDKSKAKTKSARRDAQKRKEHSKKAQATRTVNTHSIEEASTKNSALEPLLDEHIQRDFGAVS